MGVHFVLAATVITGGGYVSILKILPAVLILLLWSKLLTWADKDAVAAHLPRVPLNLGMVMGLVASYALFFMVPFYFVALPLLVVVFGAEVGTYLIIRQQKVGLQDLKGQFDKWLKSFKGTKEIKAEAGQVLLITKSGRSIEPPTGDAPDRAAYDATQIALTDPLRKGADQVDIDSRSENTLRYTVDCVPYSASGLDRASAAAAISYLKAIAGMDVEDRRKPQIGNMRVSVDKQKRDVKVQTAGSTAGEAARIEFDPKKKHDFALGDLGFSEAQLDTIRESIADNDGVVLISAPKGMGLTSLMYGVLRGHDAFLKHIQTVERDPQQDLDGITQNKLAPNATAADEFKSTDWVISQEPDVILINQIDDPRSAMELIKFTKSAEHSRRVYVGMRALSTFDALEQWRKLIGDDSVAAEQLKMVINGRVLRKLCMACKVEFTPDPAMLRKLGMNPETVTSLYQARTQPLRDPKGNPIMCEFCYDLRFKGRQGVFEIMKIDDEMRAAITGGKPIEPVFRRQRGRFLQDEALALVQAGETSVQEIKRVMKPGESEPVPQPGAGGPGGAGGGGVTAPKKPAGGRPPAKPTATAPKR